MRRGAHAVVLGAALLAGVYGGGAGGAEASEPRERIWFHVPADSDGAISIGDVLERAHLICQGLAGRYYQSGSSRLGRTLYAPGWGGRNLREVIAACTERGDRI